MKPLNNIFVFLVSFQHIVAQVDIGSRTVRRSQADYTTLVQFARKLVSATRKLKIIVLQKFLYFYCFFFFVLYCAL